MAATRFLGQFLLEQTVITSDQLKAALALQALEADQSMATKASSAGFLSKEDADRILKLRESSDEAFLEIAQNEGLLSEERVATLSTGLMDTEVTLGDALVQSGAISAAKLSGYLEECKRDVYEGAESVEKLLAARPDSELLQIITNQFTQAFMSALQVYVSADACHSDVDKVLPCEYTIYQTFKGDFEGEVHLNVSVALMLRIASKLLAEETASVNALVMDGACEFHNIVSGNICVQLSALGRKVDLDPPRYFRHPEWGERLNTPFDLQGRVGDADLTVVSLAHPSETPELCIINRSEKKS